MTSLLEYWFRKNSSREEFLKHFKDRMYTLLDCYDAQFMLLVMEIAKNIYDHAGGEGYALFIKTEKNILFRMSDFGEGSYDLESIASNSSSKAGNGINYGMGLLCIKNCAKAANIELCISTKKGFSYKGNYPLAAK